MLVVPRTPHPLIIALHDRLLLRPITPTCAVPAIQGDYVTGKRRFGRTIIFSCENRPIFPQKANGDAE